MRRDIQLLRGIAVLLVVIYHSGLKILNCGYLGVDVFFVVSGFLITTLILKSLHSNNFSFLAFYLRRAKRLLPALYCTLVFTTLFANFFLTPEQFIDFIDQFIGAVTFSSNMVLPTQISYFGDGAETKPLLHIWSLSLEEQYYFALPLFLFLLPKSWRLRGLILAILTSAVWCISWVTASGPAPFLWRFGDAAINEWAFFLFPTRAWELLAGSICAWIMLHRRNVAIPSLFKWASVGAIILLSVWGVDSIHPRGNALIVVVATAAVILGNDKWLPESPLTSGIAKVGDWSYSIYLVHWPLFVFAYLGYAEQVPLSVSASLAGIAIIAGYVQYRYVETPFRYGWENRSQTSVWSKYAATTFVLLALPFTLLGNIHNSKDVKDVFSEARKTNYGLSKECDGSFSGQQIKSDCVFGRAPRIAVWGDSFAMHLVPGLSKNNELVQLTLSACGPFIGLAPLVGKYNRAWAEECIKHNDKSFNLIVTSESIRYVILSSTFNQYFGARDGQLFTNGRVVKKADETARKSLVATVEALKNAGKRPIIFSPPPRSGFNTGLCLERKDRRLVSFRGDCDIALRAYLHHDEEIDRSLESVTRDTSTEIVWLKDFLCDKQRCKTRLEETYVYRDGGHLSVDGSIALLKHIRVGTDVGRVQ